MCKVGRLRGCMLSWDDFRYVKAIAEARSLAGAADGLGVNHSTVFRRLAQIEQQLGSRLFERGRGGLCAHGLRGADGGARRAPRRGHRRFERRVTGQDLRPSGELRVTTSDVLLLHLLTDVLIGFRRAYPEIVLDILVSNQRLNLTKRDADVAVRATYHTPEPLAGVGLPASPGRCSAQQCSRPNRSIRRATAGVTTGSRSRMPPRSPERRSGSRNTRDERRIVYKINTMIGLAEAAAAGAGLVLLPCYVGTAVPGLAQLCPPIARARRRALAAHASGPAQHRARARLPRLLRRRDRAPARRYRVSELSGDACAGQPAHGDVVRRGGR